MGLVLRLVKQQKLTAVEMDGNFTYLESLASNQVLTATTVGLTTIEAKIGSVRQQLNANSFYAISFSAIAADSTTKVASWNDTSTNSVLLHTSSSGSIIISGNALINPDRYSVELANAKIEISVVLNELVVNVTGVDGYTLNWKLSLNLLNV